MSMSSGNEQICVRPTDCGVAAEEATRIATRIVRKAALPKGRGKEHAGVSD